MRQTLQSICISGTKSNRMLSIIFQELVAVLPKKPETADDQTSYIAIHTNKMLIYLIEHVNFADNTDFLTA